LKDNFCLFTIRGYWTGSMDISIALQGFFSVRR